MKSRAGDASPHAARSRLELRTLRARIAAALEAGILRDPLSIGLSRWWASIADPVRTTPIPKDCWSIGVGGATLGGSGRTPLVKAVARVAAARAEGAAVAVVAHGYGTRRGPTGARAVATEDTAASIGDEAIELARALEAEGVPVFVGPREDALALAATQARVVVIDGLLQARPRPLTRAVLALDATDPWGAGHCPPAGDLRASRRRLIAAADAIVLLGDGRGEPIEAQGLPCFYARPSLRVRLAAPLGDGSGSTAPLTLERLRHLRVGLVTALARPNRVLRMLESHSISPELVWAFEDHGYPRAGRNAPPLDLWLTTAKCATKLGAVFGGNPVAVLQVDLELPPECVSFLLDGAFPGPSPSM